MLKPQFLAGRAALAVCALVLAAGGAAQTVLAAPQQVTVRYHTEASLPPAEICVGETAHILVRAVRDLVFTVNGSASVISERRNALWVNGTVRDPAVGALLATRQQIGFDGNTAREVEFSFVAAAAGTTQISFVAEPPGNHSVTPVNVELKVKLCRAQVTTTSVWVIPGEAGLVLIAKINRAPLVADAAGHLTGEAQVKWFLRLGRAHDCTGDIAAGTSTATLSGGIVDDELVVRAVFAEANVAISAVCVADGIALGDATVPLIPDPIELAVPVTGGFDALDQILDGPTREPGKAVMVIRPVTQ